MSNRRAAVIHPDVRADRGLLPFSRPLRYAIIPAADLQ
jgi:hypothetical protein